MHYQGAEIKGCWPEVKAAVREQDVVRAGPGTPTGVRAPWAIAILARFARLERREN
jgi:hypothetical protein